MVSTHLKNISQIRNLPQIGVKINNIPNHHLVYIYIRNYICQFLCAGNFFGGGMWCSVYTPEVWKTWTPRKGDSDPTWKLSDFKGFHVKKIRESKKKKNVSKHASWCSAASAALAQELPAASGKIWAFASKSIWTHAAWPRLALMGSMGISTVFSPTIDYRTCDLCWKKKGGRLFV